MGKSKESAGWDFLFLGATLDTIDVAKNYGFSPNKSAVYNTSKMGSCMQMVNEKVAQARLNEEINISQAERDTLVSESTVNS